MPAIPDWAETAGRYLAMTLPRGNGGWVHSWITSDQLACEALAALGRAGETPTGARELLPRQVPARSQRHDDIAVAVLWLAEQYRRLRYGLGFDAPLLAQDVQTRAVLERLGLMRSDRWLPQAQTILWRVQPLGWEMPIAADPRYRSAVQRAVDTVPDDIAEELDEIIAGPAALAMIDIPFHLRWRLEGGWLPPEEDQETYALNVFNDPLAAMMRKSVVQAIYPGRPDLLL